MDIFYVWSFYTGRLKSSDCLLSKDWLTLISLRLFFTIFEMFAELNWISLYSLGENASAEMFREWFFELTLLGKFLLEEILLTLFEGVWF